MDRVGILERHFQSLFLGINSSLLRLEFWSCFLPSFIRFAKCYSCIDLSFPVLQIFVLRIFETREEYGYNSSVEGTVNTMEQKIQVS